MRLAWPCLVCLLSGCFANTAALSGKKPMTGVPFDELGGNYILKDFDAPGFDLTADDFKGISGDECLFKDGKDSILLKVRVTAGESRTELDGFGVVNVLISSFTFLGWPFYIPEYRDYEVIVDSQLGKDRVLFTVEKNRWFSLWTPLGWLPMLFNRNSIRGEYLTEIEETALWNSVVKEGTIEAIVSTLKKRRYDLFFALQRREEEKKGFLRREIALREFIKKESPLIWRSIQELHVRIGCVDRNLEKLKTNLIEFNRDPEKDPDYQEIVGLRNEMQTSLDKIWTSVEGAYIAYLKFCATPGRGEYEEIMRNSFEIGVLEAKSVEAQFKQMTIEK